MSWRVCGNAAVTLTLTLTLVANTYVGGLF